MKVEENIPLAPYTTFHIGGPARYFTHIQTVEELREALAFAKKKELRVFVLGGGSNILIDDAGFDGLVLKIELGGVEIKKEGEHAVVVAGAGEHWDALVERAVTEGLWGVENLSGIPGLVGGAVVQNIGAYGQALSESLEWIEALDTHSGEVVRFSNKECAFDYRDSFFKHDAGRHAVLRAALKLSTEPKPNLSYQDLKTRFTLSRVEGFADASLNLGAIREAVLDIRRGKFPDLSVEGTAGSFFKNPILSKVEAKKLQERYPELPLFDMPETSGVKVPLAWFLDARHGVFNIQTMRVGGARLFEKQPLVIVAQKKSSSAGVQRLAHEVQKQIKEKIGIDIEPEVRILQK
ncbi:MAG: UDP-N-acetylmuramate dehydrogenase [Patescibacteria group bacterium]|nr:UDP-N-acetylmuramate dehydrogenase [Patescibacteria group bacterium]